MQREALSSPLERVVASQSQADDADLVQRIDALLAFLPKLESRDAGHWEGGDRRPDGTITLPWFEYDPELIEFHRACGRNGWIEVFEWPAWQSVALNYYENPGALDTAGVDDIRKLLTLHIRKDRFSEGHLATMVENGHLAAILKRLQSIRSSIL